MNKISPGTDYSLPFIVGLAALQGTNNLLTVQDLDSYSNSYKKKPSKKENVLSFAERIFAVATSFFGTKAVMDEVQNNTTNSENTTTTPETKQPAPTHHFTPFNTSVICSCPPTTFFLNPVAPNRSEIASLPNATTLKAIQSPTGETSTTNTLEKTQKTALFFLALFFIAWLRQKKEHVVIKNAPRPQNVGESITFRGPNREMITCKNMGNIKKEVSEEKSRMLDKMFADLQPHPLPPPVLYPPPPYPQYYGYGGMYPPPAVPPMYPPYQQSGG